MDILEFIKTPWAWYVAGPLIAMIMILLILSGKNFGVSANLRTMYSIAGAGKKAPFFNYNWKKDWWNLVFIVGAIIGGFLASYYLTPDQTVQISSHTIQDLEAIGIQNTAQEFVPLDIYSWENLLTVKGFVFIVLGGFLVGFGTRYAGGCTSGHAISGLSNLQLPSLIAVIGFFIGGLLMTYFLLPVII